MAGIGKGDFTVEVGCARGVGSFFLADHFGCRVLGLDYNVKHIAAGAKKAKREGYTNVSFMAASADALPLKTETVKIIISEASFSLLADKAQAASEYWRITKPGGHVIINDFTIRGDVDETLRRKMSCIPGFAWAQKVEKYQDIFEQSGFRTCSVTDASSDLIKIILWASRACSSKPVHISRTIANCVVDAHGGNKNSASETVCKEFFRQARLGYAQLIFVKETCV